MTKTPKVLFYRQMPKLAQKGDSWTWSQRYWVQSSLEATFFTGFFCFHAVKPLMAVLALLPISPSLWKTLLANTCQ